MQLTVEDCLIKDRKLKENEDAGRNGGAFYINDYRKYMTKNTFRFSCATNYFFGAEEGRLGNIENILVPLNYKDDNNERNTISDTVFWAIP